MNDSLGVLLSILFISTIFLIFLVVRLWVNAINSQQQLIILPPAENQCSPNISLLPDVSGLKNCSNPGLQYRGTKYSPSSNYIISPTPVNYTNVCETACGDDGMESVGVCKNNVNQSTYDNCIKLLKPIGCTSLSNPLGRLGDTYYFANYYGQGGCFA